MTKRKSFAMPADEANILVYNVKGQVVRGMGTKPCRAVAKDDSAQPVSNSKGVDRINAGPELHARKILMIK